MGFRKIPVAKSLWIREGGYQDSPYSFFVSQCGKVHFVGKSLSVSLILGIEKVLWIRERGNQTFPSNLFYITVPKKIRRGGSFGVSFIYGIEKVWMRRVGEYQVFPKNVFVSQCRNFSFRTGTFQCFTNFAYRKQIMLQRVTSVLFVEIFVVSHSRKIS